MKKIRKSIQNSPKKLLMRPKNQNWNLSKILLIFLKVSMILLVLKPMLLLTRGPKNKENKIYLTKSRKSKKNQVTNRKKMLKIKLRKLKLKMILMPNLPRKSILKPSQQKNLV